MNHGVVIIGDALDSRIWKMAMGRGQFIAVYTRKYVGDWRRDHWIGYSDLWHSTFVPPSSGEPLKLLLVDIDDPLYDLAAKNDRHHEDYARYEPQYDDQFFKMCRWVDRETVVVPSITDDQEGMRLLYQIRSVLSQLYERYFDQPHDKRSKSERRLRDLLMPIRLRDAWAYFLALIARDESDLRVFLTDDPAAEALIEEIKAHKYQYGVVEWW